jgi:hypothetical protein
MQRNPYNPPASTELEVPPSEVVPRPLAVWLLLLLLCAAALTCVAGMARFFSFVTLHRNELHNLSALTVAVVWRLAVIAVALFAILSIYRRGRWGRWLGLAAIVAPTIWIFVHPDDSRYPDEAQRAGAFVGRFFISPLLFAWWAYAFGFSSKAKRYFLPPPVT